jgi:hypothetical protein
MYISDYENHGVFTYNLDDSATRTYSFRRDIKEPWAIAFDDENRQLYIGDYGRKKIVVYNVTMLDETLIKSHNIWIPFLDKIDSIELDCLENRLYASDSLSNKVIVLAGRYKKWIKTINVSSPSTIRVKKKRLFVLSCTEGEVENAKRNQARNKPLEYIRKSIINANNFIYIYDCGDWVILRAISLKNWYNPRGLFVDDHLNIFTVAAVKQARLNSISESEYLFVIGTDDTIEKKKLCLGFENVNDFCVANMKAAFIFGNEKPPITVIDVL